jgi:hypothetical protein
MDISKAIYGEIKYKIFRKELKMQGRTYIWLANMIGLSYDHTRKMLNGDATLSNKNIQVLNDILEMNVPIE